MAVRVGHASIAVPCLELGNPRRVLIAGAGVAGLEAALALQALIEGKVSVGSRARGRVRLPPARRDRTVPRRRSEALPAAETRRGRRGAFAPRVARGGRPCAKVVTLENGEELGYDNLLLALGAQPREVVTGALTFRGPQDGPALSALLDKTSAGEIHRIAFAVPTGASWPLPLYELAILTAEYMSANGTRDVEILFVTLEDHPLALFGPTASKAVSELLTRREIQVETSVAAVRFEVGALRSRPNEHRRADAVVALPRLEGPRLPGVPHDENGFVPTDEYGWVLGMTDVYAAGDLTQFPLKQGGIATQQADAAASSIAADAGATVKPEPFKPVLRGLLVAGPPAVPSAGGTGADSVVDTEPLWWPPAKIVGRYLTPFLAAKLGLAETVVGPLHEGAIRSRSSSSERSPSLVARLTHRVDAPPSGSRTDSEAPCGVAAVDEEAESLPRRPHDEVARTSGRVEELAYRALPLLAACARRQELRSVSDDCRTGGSRDHAFTRPIGAARLGARPGLHGHVRLLRPRLGAGGFGDELVNAGPDEKAARGTLLARVPLRARLGSSREGARPCRPRRRVRRAG